MIVVDTNVIHYFWVSGQNTELAQGVRRRDPDWHAPFLWRSELRNILAAYLRRGLLSRSQIDGILRAVQHALAESSHHVSDAAVLDVVESSQLTAYDAEFVALAQGLSVPLVTADKAVLKAFPERALTMEAFAGRDPSAS
ncbi:MAG: type II toxin-antitoxin system VapC family toxin [Pseudomonadota bacterium]